MDASVCRAARSNPQAQRAKFDFGIRSFESCRPSQADLVLELVNTVPPKLAAIPRSSIDQVWSGNRARGLWSHANASGKHLFLDRNQA
jgi:hypothetical protein